MENLIKIVTQALESKKNSGDNLFFNVSELISLGLSMMEFKEVKDWLIKTGSLKLSDQNGLLKFELC